MSLSYRHASWIDTKRIPQSRKTARWTVGQSIEPVCHRDSVQSVPSVRPPVRPSARPPVRPSARPPVRPSVRPPVRPSDPNFKVVFGKI